MTIWRDHYLTSLLHEVAQLLTTAVECCSTPFRCLFEAAAYLQAGNWNELLRMSSNKLCKNIWNTHVV